MEIIPWAGVGGGEKIATVRAVLYKRVGGWEGKNSHSTGCTLQESEGEKIATSMGLYSTREWAGGEKIATVRACTLQESEGGGEKIATVHWAYSTRECHSPKRAWKVNFRVELCLL